MPFVKPIAQEITLQSKTGLRAVFSRYGAAVTALYVPDRNGRMQNIVYADPEAFGGQIIAPIAGRIRGGKVPIHGKIWQMPCDSQGIAQHSGPENTARHIWTLAEQNADTVIFSTRLADGACGLPGNRVCTAMYRLRENCLELGIAIKTDQDTFVNPTSHLYWNLAGDFSHPIEGQLLQFSAPYVWYNDAFHLPQEKHSTAGTVFDFAHPRAWQPLPKGEKQLSFANGYNHAFQLTKGSLIQLYCPANGRSLCMETNMSHLVMYSGGYLPVQGCALALEAQGLPDAPYLMGKGLPILRAGRTFHWRTRFYFFCH